MAMQFKVFRVPACNGTQEEQELNSFLGAVRVLTVHRDFVASSELSFVVFTVEYFSDGKSTGGSVKKSRVDYRELLSPEVFFVFSALRKWRKEQALIEATAVYTIFTNEQLAQIAKKQPDSKADLQKISGIGAAKSKKYGDMVLAILRETNGKQQDPSQ